MPSQDRSLTKETKKTSLKKNKWTEAKKNIQKENLKLSKGVCKKTLIQALGLSGINSQFSPFRASNEERHFCINSKYTCCNSKAFVSAQKWFIKNWDIFQQSQEWIQEILSLFRGPKYSILLNDLKKNSKCHFFLFNSQNKEESLKFFDEEEVKFNIDNIGKQSVQFGFYKKNIRAFYSNIICTICNPLNDANLILVPGETTINVNINTLEKRLEILEYEINLVRIVERFVYPLAKVIQCHLGLQNDPTYFLPMIDFSKANLIQTQIDLCIADTTFSNLFCKLLMNIKIFKHQFSVDINHQTKQALKIIYLAMTGNMINNFYGKYKNDVKDEYFDYHYELFDKMNKKFRKLKLANTVFELHDHGIDIYQNIMSANFFLQKSSAIAYWSSLAIILMIIWTFFENSRSD
jgi:hypothetical protein